jgi:preprotein translocase subunit SecG
MYSFIIVLLIIVSILLGLIILVQNSKGGGLAAGLSASNQVLGVRKTTDFLEKLTWGLAIGLLVLAMVANFAIPKESTSSTGGSSVIQEEIDNTADQQPQQQQPQAPANTAAPDTAK